MEIKEFVEKIEAIVQERVKIQRQMDMLSFALILTVMITIAYTIGFIA